MQTNYSWSFFKQARTIHPHLANGDALAALSTLDREKWLVLSAPVKAAGYNYPIATLLDTDHDGRVRIPEVLAAVAWLKPRLTSLDVLFTESTAVARSEINTTTEEGRVLSSLFDRLAPQGSLPVEACSQAIADFTASPFNGDGVITPTALDTQYADVLGAMVAVTGGAAATDGTMGINAALLETFTAERKVYADWIAAQPDATAVTGADFKIADIITLVRRLTPKVNAYFTACALVRYNPAALESLVAPVNVDALTDAPIALPSATAEGLPFADGINPCFAADMQTLGAWAMAKIDPTTTRLTPQLWQKIQDAVAPFAGWLDARPACADVFVAITPELLTLIDAPATQQALQDALAKDSEQTPLASAFEDMNRLVVYRTSLLRYMRNFVNMQDLYPSHKPSATKGPVKVQPMFLVGTLFMDGRACRLCFPIEKAPADHAKLAAESKSCLAYCEIKRPGSAEKRLICAVFTAGTVEALTVGRNGIFFDNDGVDWEATIVHMVQNPMSLREAFFTPWRKIGATLAGFATKFVSSKSDSAVNSTSTALTTSANKATAPSTPAPAANSMNSAVLTSSLAAVGIAVGLIGSAIAGLISMITALPLWKTGCGVLAIILIVSLPSVILTWFKLRSRDLAQILNASGWAVNRRIGLTANLGRFFTTEARYMGARFVLVPGATRSYKKPLLVVLALVCTAWVLWWFFCPLSPRNFVDTGCPCHRHKCEQLKKCATLPAGEPAPKSAPVATPAP